MPDASETALLGVVGRATHLTDATVAVLLGHRVRRAAHLKDTSVTTRRPRLTLPVSAVVQFRPRPRLTLLDGGVVLPCPRQRLALPIGCVVQPRPRPRLTLRVGGMAQPRQQGVVQRRP